MFILTIVVFVIDLVSKLIVSNLLNVHDSIVVIKGIFNISCFIPIW
jgi:lipoprotein signal peptidase